MASQITTPDGCRLYININNDSTKTGPTLILVHHWGGSPRLFAPLLYEPAISSLRAVTYHARGWSPSTGPNPEDATKYGIPAMASDLEHIVTFTVANHSSEGFILVGHSMGAKVAQYFAATCPAPLKTMLKGLILVAPAPLRRLVVPEGVKKQQISAYQSAEAAEMAIRHVLLAKPDALNDGLVKQMVEDALRGSDEAKAAWPAYGSSSNFESLQKEIGLPALVLRGDKDWEKDIVGQLGEDQEWVNVVVEDCGHLIPQEKPGVLAAQIRAFVKDNNLE